MRVRCARELIDYDRVGARQARTHCVWRIRCISRKSASAARRADFDAFQAEQGETLLRFACFEVLRARNMRRGRGRSGRSPGAIPQRASSMNCARRDARGMRIPRIRAVDRRPPARRLCGRGAPRSACRSGSTSILLSASTATAPMPGARRRPCSPMSRSARRPTSSIRVGQDWGLAPFNPHAMPASDFAADARIDDVPPCVTPAPCGSITCWA